MSGSRRLLAWRRPDHLLGDAIALVGPDEDLRPAVLLEIGVVLQDGFALLEGHGREFLARPLLCDAGRPGLLDLLDEFVEFGGVGHRSISQKRLVLGRPGFVGHVRLDLQAFVPLLELVDVRFLELPKGLVERLVLHGLDRLFQVLGFGRQVPGIEAAGQDGDVVLDFFGRAAGGAQAAHDAVEGPSATAATSPWIAFET